MDEVILDNYSIRFHSEGNQHLPWWRPHDNLLDRHHRFSIIASPYNGLISPYIGYPFFRFFGFDQFGLRIFHLTIGAASVFLLFLLLSSVLPSLFWPLMGTLLVVSDSNFFISFRTQYQNGLISLPFFIGGLLCLVSANASKRRLFVSGALLALAFFGYFNYWCLLPACILWARLFVKEAFLKPRLLAVWALGFLVGIAPLIYAYVSMYVHDSSGSFSDFFQTLIHNNLSMQAPWHSNLWRLLTLTFHMIGNSLQPLAIVGPFPLSFVSFKSWIIVVGIATGAAIFITKHKRQTPESVFFGWCIFSLASFLLLASLFGTRFNEHHLIAVQPLILVASVYPVAFAVGSLRSAHPTFHWKNLFLIGPLALTLLAGLVQQSQIVERLRETGGVGNFSDAIYHLRYSVERNHRTCHIYLPDWGFWTSLVFLTEGKLSYTLDFPQESLEATLSGQADRDCLAIIARSAETKALIRERRIQNSNLVEYREVYRNRLGAEEFTLFRFQRSK